MKAVRILSALVALALVANVALAQPGGGRGGRGARGGGLMALMGSPIDRLQTQLKQLTLSDDEKTKVDAVIKDYEPKVKDAVDAAKKTLTEDNQKALADVVKEIADAGTDRTARRTAMQKMNDIKLSDDEKKALQEKSTALNTLSRELRTKIGEALTAENKTKLNAMRGGPGGGRGGRGGAGGAGGGAAPAAKPEA